MRPDWLAWRHEAENFARAAPVIERGVDGMPAQPETRMRGLGSKLGTKIFINHNRPPLAVTDKLWGVIASGCEIYRDAPSADKRIEFEREDCGPG